MLINIIKLTASVGKNISTYSNSISECWAFLNSLYPPIGPPVANRKVQAKSPNDEYDQEVSPTTPQHVSSLDAPTIELLWGANSRNTRINAR